MQTRVLGRTGYQVSEIGLGAWGLGGGIWKGVADEEGRRAVHAALDAGVNFIDTALVYGDGHSERLVRQVLAEREDRDRIIVATKIPPEDRVWPADPDKHLSAIFAPHYLRSSVEESLRNLGLQALHLVQLHVWHDRWLESPVWQETRDAMKSLLREGKVLHWGVSVASHAPETALQLIRDPLIEAVQAIYNIYDRSPEEALFDLVREKRTGVIVRVPLDEGGLTGAVTADSVFQDGDFRERYFKGDRRAEAGRRAEALTSLLGEEAKSLPELALRFALHRPEVSTVIPGMRRPEHARANAAVSDGRSLSPEILRRLREHAWRKNWYRPD